jgi:hypothetical protein
MKNPFTGKELTPREQQLIAIVVGIIEQSKPLRPTELLNSVNPAPTWSESEIKDALATLIDAGRVELTSDRKLRMAR